MNRKFSSYQQAEWLAWFVQALLARHPRLSGHIDLDAARNYFFSGTPIDRAVVEYCIARNIE